jgi:cobalt/nickel transport system permease protein
MIDELYDLEHVTYRDSPVHRLDARVKILICFACIIAVVAFPYSTQVYLLGGVMLLFFLCLWVFSYLPPLVYLKRFLVILPFGFFIIFFQIFFENPHYSSFHAILDLPFGIHVYAESVEFATILGAKYLICISFIILLSSTTAIQDLLEGAGRLGLPPEFALVLGMMVRYLFVFAGMFNRVINALETRCFDIFDSSLSYTYRIRQMSYTIGSIFIRSLEQGERTYTSMLCRGYGKDSYIFLSKKPLRSMEWILLAVSFIFIVAASVGIYLLEEPLFLT